MTFLALQLRDWDNFTRLLFTVAVVFVLTSGHCMQPGPPHFWFSSCFSSKDNTLFLTTVLPIEGFFLIARTILVLPMILFKSGSASLMIFRKVLRS